MITIDFAQRQDMSLTDFLYSSIKKQILDGVLSENEKLPSKRALALHLGVSVITVQNAYSQLIDE
ncbi:MAG: winged helix-turn-helix transcriptional regulator, partial [Spirochaetaceae bacterium]|nr:winged helix-turn-helix transcriptional regulator [Spirochaetaceae bacterium]